MTGASSGGGGGGGNGVGNSDSPGIFAFTFLAGQTRIPRNTRKSSERNKGDREQ